MIYQLIFSVIAIALLYLFNKKIGGYSPSSFKNEQMAIDIFRQDMPDTKSLKLGPLLFLNQSTALFEYSSTNAKNEQQENSFFAISQATGDIFVSRLLPLSLLLNCAKHIETIGHKYSIQIEPADLTLPPIQIKFSDADPIYYWFLDNKIIDTKPPLNAQPSPSMEAQ